MNQQKEENSNSQVSRRSLLRNAGLTGASIIGISGRGSANSTIEREITELEGRERAEFLRKARLDSNTWLIETTLRRDDLRPKVSKGKVIKVRNAHRDSDIKTEKYHLVLIPYEPVSYGSKGNTDREEAVLLWVDKRLPSIDLPQIISHKINNKITYKKPDQLERNDDVTGETTRTVVTTYTVKNGRVQSKTREADPSSPAGKDSIITSDVCCEVRSYNCEDISLWCYLGIAGSLAGTYWSCSVCLVDPTRVTCGKCAFIAVTSSGSTYGCLSDIDCEPQADCIDMTEVPVEERCSTCINIDHPNC
ncbi:MAG: hypothetical protein V5A34_02000 [Halapricum sp.]